jgi:hypothetical protein
VSALYCCLDGSCRKLDGEAFGLGKNIEFELDYIVAMGSCFAPGVADNLVRRYRRMITSLPVHRDADVIQGPPGALTSGSGCIGPNLTRRDRTPPGVL